MIQRITLNEEEKKMCVLAIENLIKTEECLHDTDIEVLTRAKDILSM